MHGCLGRVLVGLNRGRRGRQPPSETNCDVHRARRAREYPSAVARCHARPPEMAPSLFDHWKPRPGKYEVLGGGHVAAFVPLPGLSQQPAHSWAGCSWRGAWPAKLPRSFLAPCLRRTARVQQQREAPHMRQSKARRHRFVPPLEHRMKLPRSARPSRAEPERLASGDSLSGSGSPPELAQRESSSARTRAACQQR